MLATSHLTKRYGRTSALSDCSLRIESGEVVGLLGPNGAGKTTLVRLLMGFLVPTSGEASIAGFDCTRQSLEVRRRVGYVPGNVRLFGRMRVNEVMQFLSGIRAGSDVSQALQMARAMGLPGHRKIAYLSTGMRQKLALAAVFHADVQVLILDEPTANLDPTMRAEVLDRVRGARNLGKTILFSSHVLSEIEEICDRVVLLREGRLVHTQNLSELRRIHRIQMSINGPLPDVPEKLRDQVRIHTDDKGGVAIEASCSLTPLLEWLAAVHPDELSVEPMRLRAVYDQHFTDQTSHQE